MDGREAGREVSIPGSEGGAGPRKVKEGRRERIDVIAGFLVVVGEVGCEVLLDALIGDGAGAASGIMVVVVVRFVLGWTGFRFLAEALNGDEAISD